MSGNVKLRNVTVAFETAEGIKIVLNDITLDINDASFIVMIGRNGSGKSTLAKVIAGLCPTSRGQVLVSSAGKPARAQLVFQNPDTQIVGQTIYEDVCFGLENLAIDPTSICKQASAALHAVGLDLDKGTPVDYLSGGQKQLLCIASAVAMEAAVLILDEPTSMLDGLARKRIWQQVQKLHQMGMTILWLTQYPDEAAESMRIVALDGGQIVFDGQPTDFFSSPLLPLPHEGPASPSVCESLGYDLPYSIQIARLLRQQGLDLPIDLVRTRELVEALAKRKLGREG